MKRRIPGTAFILATAMFTLLAANASAQYKRTDLVSNQPGVATDSNLINGWGLTRSSGSPFWVSDNVTGKSTLYTGSGTIVNLVVTIPPASGNTTGTPTGTVFNITVVNPTPAFAVSKNGKTAPAFFSSPPRTAPSAAGLPQSISPTPSLGPIDQVPARFTPAWLSPALPTATSFSPPITAPTAGWMFSMPTSPW